MSHSRLSLFWLVITVGVSVSLHISKLPPAIAILQSDLGISLVDAGFLLSTVQFAGMLLGLAIGLSADSWGLRRSMLAGLLLMATGSMVGALAQGFAWLLACRMVEGLGFLLTVMPGPGLIRRHLSAEALNRRMSWWGSYMPVGIALGLILSPWVLQWTSWRVLWLALGAVNLLAIAAVLRYLPADPAPASRGAADAPPPASAGWRPRLALTLRAPAPWLLSASSIARNRP